MGSGGTMKIAICLSIIMTIICLVSATGRAQNQRGPSTAEERSSAVTSARLLESEPFHKDAKKIHQWFIRWLTEIPDITVEACTAYFGPAGDKKYKYSSELLTQSMYSAAAFIIEHPTEVPDRLNVNLAGVEGALNAYAAMVRADPKARHDHMDGLLAKRDKGELRAYVERISKTGCSKK